jgi:hypothetical protein
MDGVQLSAGELFWVRLLFRLLFRFGVRQSHAEAHASQRQGAGQNNPSFVYECLVHNSSTFICYLL